MDELHEAMEAAADAIETILSNQEWAECHTETAQEAFEEDGEFDPLTTGRMVRVFTEIREVLGDIPMDRLSSLADDLRGFADLSEFEHC